VGSRGHRGGQQPRGQGIQVEAPIEPVSDRAQVTLGVLVEVKGVIRAAQAALHIAEDRIDPVQHGHFFGLAPAHDEQQGKGSPYVDPGCPLGAQEDT
jgi:hypothetical protein